MIDKNFNNEKKHLHYPDWFLVLSTHYLQDLVAQLKTKHLITVGLVSFSRWNRFNHIQYRCEILHVLYILLDTILWTYRRISCVMVCI